MPDRLRRRRLAIGAVAIAAAILPRPVLDHLPTTCPFRLITGYPCPTCGRTRSWHSVAHLDPIRAVRDHPFGPLVLGGLMIAASSPARGEMLAVRVGRLPTRAKTVALAAWLGWWAVQLVATHRRR